MLSCISLRPGETVEICGDRGSGKTTLLMEVAVSCVLPQSVGSLKIGGHGATAVLFDTEANFSLRKFALMLYGRLLEAGLCAERATREAHECMGRLLISRCYTRREFLFAIASLCRTASRPHASATVLLIDRSSTYLAYWSEHATPV